MIANNGILYAEVAESADDADCVFDFVSFDLRVGEVESGIFFSPDGRDCGCAGLDEVTKTEDAVIGGELASFDEDNDGLHFVWAHSIDELVL